MQSDFMRQKNLSQHDKKTHSLQVATWKQPFLLPGFFCHRNATNQAEIFGAATRAEMANIEEIKEIIPLIRREIPFGHLNFPNKSFPR